MPRIALIVNPFASGVDDERLAAVERELRVAGEVTTMLTERPLHATELAESSGRDYEAVVVFSGDGGFNEALNGADGDIPLGFIPGGGTSVLPRALGLPRDPVEAARTIATAIAANRTRRISLGRVNGRRFGFSAGIGFDAELVRRVDALGRTSDGRRAGDLKFILEVVRLIAARRGRFQPAVEIEGRGRAAFALVSNCDPYTFAASLPLHVAPQARFELGLDLIAPVEVRPTTVLRLVRYLVTGKGQESDAEIVYAHDVDRIEVRCDAPMPLQADGEDLGDVTEFVCEAERDAVSVLV
ncbi:MAG: diacylglycerol kinase family protein [Thermoleophilia bacterium]